MSLENRLDICRQLGIDLGKDKPHSLRRLLCLLQGLVKFFFACAEGVLVVIIDEFKLGAFVFKFLDC